MTQVLLLGIAGSMLGVAIAAAVIAAVPAIVGNIATIFHVEYGLTATAVAQGLAVGLLVSVLFSLVPLLDVRHVKPSLLLRHDIPPLARFDWVKWGVGVRTQSLNTLAVIHIIDEQCGARGPGL